jgi:hypothetical protein
VNLILFCNYMNKMAPRRGFEHDDCWQFVTSCMMPSAKQQRRGEEQLCLHLLGRSRWGGAFRRADAAQVRSNVMIVDFDGAFECSSAMAARQIVSETW